MAEEEEEHEEGGEIQAESGREKERALRADEKRGRKRRERSDK